MVIYISSYPLIITTRIDMKLWIKKFLFLKQQSVLAAKFVKPGAASHIIMSAIRQSHALRSCGTMMRSWIMELFATNVWMPHASSPANLKHCIKTPVPEL